MVQPEPENKYKSALEKIAKFEEEDVFDCSSCGAAEIAKEVLKEPELNLEEGSTKITLRDIYVMFYILLKQNQKLHPGGKISFDLRAFKNLPKKIEVQFERKHGRLFAWIPGLHKRKKVKKSGLFLPKTGIITPI